jgi:hypothetical protein
MQTRWDRLHDALDAAGITHRMVQRAYPGGISHSINISLSNGERIIIRDKWFREMWSGWNVSREDVNDFAHVVIGKTKVRGEIVRAVAAEISKGVTA